LTISKIQTIRLKISSLIYVLLHNHAVVSRRQVYINWIQCGLRNSPSTCSAPGYRPMLQQYIIFCELTLALRCPPIDEKSEIKTKNKVQGRLLWQRFAYVCCQNRHLAFVAKAKLSANDLTNLLCKIIFIVLQYTSAIFQPRRQHTRHMNCSNMFCAHCMTL
jgi:hypothetical protein